MVERFPQIADHDGAADGAPVLNPAAIAAGALARMLGLPSAVVHRHIEQGAPVNHDGSINLIHYAAWLNAPGSPGSSVQEGADVGLSTD